MGAGVSYVREGFEEVNENDEAERLRVIPRYAPGERIWGAGPAGGQMIIRDTRIRRGAVDYVVEELDTGFRSLIPESEIKAREDLPGARYVTWAAHEQAMEIARVRELRRQRAMAADRSNHGHGHDH